MQPRYSPEADRDARTRYKSTTTATTLMPNRKPNDWGNRFRLLEDPIFPPMWRAVFPIITRKLKKVENSYEKRAMQNTGTCMANSNFAHLNPLGVARQSAAPVGMHQANKAVDRTPDIPARTWCR